MGSGWLGLYVNIPPVWNDGNDISYVEPAEEILLTLCFFISNTLPTILVPTIMNLHTVITAGEREVTESFTNIFSLAERGEREGGRLESCSH